MVVRGLLYYGIHGTVHFSVSLHQVGQMETEPIRLGSSNLVHIFQMIRERIKPTVFHGQMSLHNKIQISTFVSTKQNIKCINKARIIELNAYIRSL